MKEFYALARFSSNDLLQLARQVMASFRHSEWRRSDSDVFRDLARMIDDGYEEEDRKMRGA